MGNKVQRRCPHCHKKYILGENGVKGTCDDCAHITRDQSGYAWYPTEKKILMANAFTGATRELTRNEAFGKK